jgi:hypothetical protein
MKVRFLSAARDELREGIRYYHRQRAGLGAEFREEEILIVAVAHVHREPEYWRQGLRSA